MSRCAHIFAMGQFYIKYFYVFTITEFSKRILEILPCILPSYFSDICLLISTLNPNSNRLFILLYKPFEGFDKHLWKYEIC